MTDEAFQQELDALLAEFGQKVRGSREATGLTQEEFARKLSIHRTEISAIERGRREPRLSVLLILAQGLGMEIGELVRNLSVPRTRRIQSTRRQGRD
jgi:transcriptional regulator with XRE-family HTH domain